MLTLLGFLLVHMVFGAEGELKVNNYILEIDEYHTLKSIRPTQESTSELDLSSLGIECVDKNVFQNLNNVETLNLANNSLYGVPAAVFANLTNLKHLSLAGNKMLRFENTFVGLENLKSLNISDLPMETLYEGYLYGLTKATDIIVLNNKFSGLYSNTFTKGPNYDEPPTRTKRSAGAEADDKAESDNPHPDVKEITTSSRLVPERVQICVQEGILSRVETLETGVKISSGCTEIEMHYYNPNLNLENMNITKFEAGWYRRKVGIDRFTRIDLRKNNIVRVTSEFLNDLPEDVRYVNLAGNKIERLEKGIIKNNHIKILDLTNNFISEMEDGALENTKITELYLSDNRLKDTKFAAALPSTLETLRIDHSGITELTPGSFSKLNNVRDLKLQYNNITSCQLDSFQGLSALIVLVLAGNGLTRIEPASFSKLNNLRDLNLRNNNITSLQEDSLQGLSALSSLEMTGNGLTRIEPGTFRHLKKAEELILSKNNINSLEKGVFDGLETNFILKLTSNKFTKITKDTFADMPETLLHLYLDNNEIESVETGGFTKLNLEYLALNGNKISKIEKGSFDLPKLKSLSLDRNLLSNVDGDSFEGLGNVTGLTLSSNGITRLTKGSMKNLKSLQYLDISGNPIKRLDNGALFGLSKSSFTRITITEGSLELLQGGVFDDA